MNAAPHFFDFQLLTAARRPFRGSIVGHPASVGPFPCLKSVPFSGANRSF
jgi:hypothetical protein